MRDKLDIRYPSFGRRVKAAIAAKGEDLRAVSSALGVTYESVRRYAGGVSMPRQDALQALAVHLGVTKDYLLGEQEELASESATILASPPSKEQMERLESLLRGRHPNGFQATVMQPLQGGMWTRRITTSRAGDAPQYFLLIGGSSIDELMEAIE